MNITILIPTMNRPHFIKRALGYYEKIYFEGTILVGDSSNDDSTKQIIDKFRKCLNINYAYLPVKEYVHDGACMKNMLALVKTDFAVYQGDDDFLVPNGLQKCIDFLGANEGYSATYGLRANVYYEGEKIVAGYLQKAIEFDADSPLERWTQYMQTGLSTQNYVHRTETWKEMYFNVDKIPMRYFGPELLPCSMTAILGKTKYVDCLHYVMHKDSPDRQVDWGKISFWDYIVDVDWPETYRLLCNFMVDAGISRDDFKKVMWLHVSAVLGSLWQRQHHPQGKPENRLYKDMLNPKFIGYSDFMQVYRL